MAFSDLKIIRPITSNIPSGKLGFGALVVVIAPANDRRIDLVGQLDGEVAFGAAIGPFDVQSPGGDTRHRQAGRRGRHSRRQRRRVRIRRFLGAAARRLSSRAGEDSRKTTRGSSRHLVQAFGGEGLISSPTVLARRERGTVYVAMLWIRAMAANRAARRARLMSCAASKQRLFGGLGVRVSSERAR